MESVTTPEIQQPLNAADIATHMNDLRHQQDELLMEAGTKAQAALTPEERITNGAEVREAAHKQAAEGFDEMYSDYLSQHIDPKRQPEQFAKALDLMRMSGVDKMTSEEWHLGEADADGNHNQPETSGRARFEKAFAELVPDPEAAKSALTRYFESEEYTEMQADLKVKREALAKLSIHRRQKIRKGGKEAKRLAQEFEEAQAAYDAAFQKLTIEHARAWISDGLKQETLTVHVIRDVLKEKKAFTKAEYSVLEDEDSKRARVAKWLAHKHRLSIFNVVSGVGLGYGAKALVAGATGVVAGLALPVALGAGAAVATTKAVLNAAIGNRAHLHRNFDERSHHDYSELLRSVSELDDENHENVIQRGSQLLQGNINHRVERDRRSNRNRVIKAGALSLAGAGIGEVLATHGTLAIHHHALFDHNHNGNTNHTTEQSGAGSGTGNTNGSTNAGGVAKHLKPGNGGTDGSNIHHGASADGRHFGPGHGQNPKVVDGYHTNVQVEAGHGYTNELQDLAAQKGYHLTGAQAWQAYQSVNQHVHGNFFTNDHSYLRTQGDWGISHPGAAHWNPAAIDHFNSWMTQHQDVLTKTTKVAKKAAKVAVANHR